jgi:hypothetical protein
VQKEFKNYIMEKENLSRISIDVLQNLRDFIEGENLFLKV